MDGHRDRDEGERVQNKDNEDEEEPMEKMKGRRSERGIGSVNRFLDIPLVLSLSLSLHLSCSKPPHRGP